MFHLGVILMVLSALAAAIHLVLPGPSSFTSHPETGTSVIAISGARDDYFTWVDTLTEFKQRFNFIGLNYNVLGADGTEISAGRYATKLTVTLDENGRIIDETFTES
jgi:hypothetical protein